MSAHPYEGPKDKTNPYIYLPVALVSVVIVVAVFASGLMRGLHDGQLADKKAPRVEKKRPAVNVRALAEPTPELLALGRQIYGLNCASCHGPDGRGDGEKGTSLNPKPRNLHDASDLWKNSASLTGMWKTLEQGVAGSSMSSFLLTPPDERMAVIHYIRQNFVPDAPETTAAEVASLPGPGAGDSGGIESLIAAAEAGGPTIPVELAMARLREPAIMPVHNVRLPRALQQLHGAALYATHCASCHGPSGEGAEGGRVVSSFPYVRLATRPLLGSTAAWTNDRDAFAALVATSGPGRREHGFATLTREQLDHLHEYAAALAREGASH
ncbi:MAG: cytochrome c [Candidatus Sumerlaeia bacterium]|nr:cytochrome c [Candidatus Sumerlaeia bacterium]